MTLRSAGPEQQPTRKCERIYSGGFEVYREYDASGTTVTLERVSLSVLDGTQRIAQTERRTVGDDGTAELLVRFQLGNHLGSACLELDADGTVISYEEYHPYGSTSYQAVDPAARAAAKRYRFTGMERDEATGLQYHSARYYAPWLGRWTSADPAGLVDGPNLYRYSRSNPVGFADPSGMSSAEIEHYDMFWVGHSEAIGQIAQQAGFDDAAGLLAELEATSVGGVGRVQVAGRDIEIALGDVRYGSASSSFTQFAGIDHAIGVGLTAFLNSPLGVAPRTALNFHAKNISRVPGLADTLTAVAESEPFRGTLGLIGDATMLSALTGMIRFGTTRTANLLADSRMNQKLLTDSRVGGLALAEAQGGELAIAGSSGGELAVAGSSGGELAAAGGASGGWLAATGPPYKAGIGYITRVAGQSATFPDHFWVTIRHGGAALTTHVYFTPEKVAIVERLAVPSAAVLQSADTRAFRVSDALAAMKRQEWLMGEELGVFGVTGVDPNCATHVCGILNVGGLDVPIPSGSRQSILFLYNLFGWPLPKGVR